MARTTGAKNRPKLVTVKLSDLMSKFNSDMTIPVGVEFAKAMMLNYNMIEIEDLVPTEPKDNSPAPTIRVIEKFEEEE